MAPPVTTLGGMKIRELTGSADELRAFEAPRDLPLVADLLGPACCALLTAAASLKATKERPQTKPDIIKRAGYSSPDQAWKLCVGLGLIETSGEGSWLSEMGDRVATNI